MNINDAFPSNYLKASDLKGQLVTVLMSDVRWEKLGDDDKPVLYFEGKEKGLVLNKTNANNIAGLYGPETSDWLGKAITLVESMVDFQGRSMPAIRVRAPARNARPASPNAPLNQTRQSDERNPPPREMADLDDEIPF